MDSGHLSALARRIENLEQRTWGNNPRLGLNPVTSRLAEYSTDLGNSLVGHDRITPLLKRIDELEAYLDPMFGEGTGQSDRVKQSIVLSQEDKIREDYSNLQKVKTLSSELEGGKLKDIGTVEKRLEELNRLQLTEREQSDNLNKQTLELVEKYNNIISDLTTAFNQADATVTAAEEKIKKPVYY